MADPRAPHTRRGEAHARRTSDAEWAHEHGEHDGRVDGCCPVCIENELAWRRAHGYGLEVDR